MLTPEQQEWVNHLSDTNIISVLPYNPKTKTIFKMIKKDLINVLGKTRISLRGSTALGIAGQGEIDLYIPISNRNFNVYLDKLIKYLGQPGSVYPLRRVRFVKYIDDIKIEIFLINKNHSDWKRSIKFEKILRNDPNALKEYETLKIQNDGTSPRNYYAKKIEFINNMLS
ncbi:MAG: GrpB family protein [Candidatus Magasanikbacteria bacterium]|nr:GrpB family protein [Candidatus Magasanikbacteria bacterium]